VSAVSPFLKGAFWIALVIALLPPVIGYGVLGFGYVQGCAPSELACGGAPIGEWLKSATSFSWQWAFGFAPALALLMGLCGALLGSIWRALIAALTPLAAIVLPSVLVMSAAHETCMVNEGGVGDCVVWGVSMGDTFHTASIMVWVFLFAVPACAIGGLIAIIAAIAVKIARRRSARSESKA